MFPLGFNKCSHTVETNMQNFLTPEIRCKNITELLRYSIVWVRNAVIQLNCGTFHSRKVTLQIAPTRLYNTKYVNFSRNGYLIRLLQSFT